MIVESCAFTHPGYKRQNNEDAYYTNDKQGLWVVCDGMGGHQEGSFASHLVTDIFEQMRISGSFHQKVDAIASQIYTIHKLLQKKVKSLGNGIVVGTTLVVLYIDGEQAVSIHCGDSRCYILRDTVLSLVTKDHAKNIKDGDSERKVLTRALFAPGELSLELKRFEVKKGDTFLLCSDGMYDNLEKEEIHQGMCEADLDKGIHMLSNEVLSGIADDNLTAVMVRIHE